MASPDRALTCVLVAGTKGKGSTAAFLASVLAAADVRAGLFTSPHLQEWRERVRVDGVALSRRAFDAAVDAALAYVPAVRRNAPELGEPSAFEILVAAALAHFERERCRVAVLEVGLGGRYDATNAVQPTVSAITRIGLDHVAVLGGTLAAIATEKAGVMRTGRPALIADQTPSAARALGRACREIEARCRTVRPLGSGSRLGIAGSHQRQNAALARAAALELGEQGVPMTERAIVTGLRRVRWPGRFEVVRGRPTVVLDIAHTPESAEALARALRREFPRRRIHLIFGCTSDRDPVAIARPLLRLAASVHAVAAAGARAMPAAEVAKRLGPSALHHRTVRDGLVAARDATKRGEIVCVTGSAAAVGEARGTLKLRVADRLW